MTLVGQGSWLVIKPLGAEEGLYAYKLKCERASLHTIQEKTCLGHLTSILFIIVLLYMSIIITISRLRFFKVIKYLKNNVC